MNSSENIVDAYVGELRTELERRGMPEHETTTAEANVRERVAESGQPPEKIFGPPRKHAKRLAALDAPPTSPERSAARIILMLAASWFGTGALIALTRGESSLGMPAVIPLVVCVLVMVAVIVDVRRSEAAKRR